MVQSSASVEIVLLSSVVSCEWGCFTWFLLLRLLQHPQLMSDAPCYFHTYGSFYIWNVRYYQGPEDNKVFFKNVKKKERKNVSFVQIHLIHCLWEELHIVPRVLMHLYLTSSVLWTPLVFCQDAFWEKWAAQWDLSADNLQQRDKMESSLHLSKIFETSYLLWIISALWESNEQKTHFF